MPWTDYQIWQRFLLSSSALFDSYSYDVLLSIGAPPASVADPAMLRMWRENTSKRMDAVARKGDVLTIIEVRELATWQTIGQVLGYQTLAEREFADEHWSRPMIVTGGIAAGVEPAIHAQHITLIVLPPEH